ncbi:MAG: transcriptional regulator [Myxococcales bacterium]|nr:transcriptional regulator [Myxococcales bacterium]
MTDHALLASEILRALRGRRSQVAFSRRLGYRSNVAATWESGRRSPAARVVLAAAERLGIDVRSGLKRFYKVDTDFLDEVDPTSHEGVCRLLRDLRRDQGIAEVARRCGASRYQVSRWLSGKTHPRLPELLGLVDAMTHRLLDFVAILVDPGDLPSVAAAWAKLEAARSLFWRMPHAQLVLLALDLQDYRGLAAHDDAWLADRLGLELYEVAGAIASLQATDQIRRDGAHFVVSEVHTVDTRRHPEAGTALKRWWARQALQRLEEPETSWSYNAFTLAEADLPKVVELYRSTFRAMRALVAESTPSERVVLVHQVVVPLDGPTQD